MLRERSISLRFFSAMVLGASLLTPFFAHGGGGDQICSKFVEKRGYQKFYTTRQGTRAAGDTIYWETKVLPDFRRIAQDPKFQNEAILNSKMKAMFASYGLRENEISSANQDRILQDCHSRPQLEGCLAMQSYCVRDYVETQFPKAMENFIGCADPVNRRSGCGKEFQSADGIQKNLNVLRNFDRKLAEIDADLMKLPNVPEYLEDIQQTFKAYSDRIQTLLAKGKGEIEKLKQQEAAAADARYRKAKAGNDALGEACRAFDECKGYIARQGYADTKEFLKQISSCQVDGKTTEVTSKQFDATMKTLKNVRSAAHQDALVTLAQDTFAASMQTTARQYLEGQVAVNGSLPSASAFCKALGRCGDPKIQAVYDDVKSRQASIPRMDLAAEITEFNSKVKKLNSACEAARTGALAGGAVEGLVEAVRTAHGEVVSGTTFGTLFAIDKFTDKTGKFDEDDCVGEGVGIRELSPAQDTNRVKQSLNALLGTIAEKGRELSKEEKDLTDPKDPGPGIRHFLEYEPLVLREMIRTSNSPEQAMLLCQAIEKIYAKEASRKLRSKVLTGLSIVGGIAAIVLTGGAATPLVLAAASITGGTALAVGITNSILNIRNANQAEEKYEFANATGSFDRGLAQSLISEYGMEVRAETVGLALNFVPGVGKVAGKTLNKTVIQPAMRTKFMGVVAKTPVWKTAAKGTSYSAKAVGSLMTKMNNGTAAVGDVSAALVAKIHPGTSRAMVAFFNSATKGMTEDLALTFAAMALTHPDPYSEAGMLELFESFIASRGMAALGNSGRQVYANLKGSKGKVASLPKGVSTEDSPSAVPDRKPAVAQLVAEPVVAPVAKVLPPNASTEAVLAASALHRKIGDEKIAVENPRFHKAKIVEDEGDGSFWVGYDKETIRAKIDGKDTELGSLSYRLDEDEPDLMEIGWARVDESVRQQGVQNLLFKRVFEQNPNVKRIRTSLDDSNAEAFAKGVADQMKKQPGYRPNTAPPDPVQVDRYRKKGYAELVELNECCREFMQKLKKEDPKRFETLLRTALMGTPAWRTREKFGFTELSIADYGYNDRKGSVSFVTHFEVTKAGADVPSAAAEKTRLRAEAEQELGRKVTDSEVDGIYRSHIVGRKELGKDGSEPAEKFNYTPAQLKEKTRQMREAGLSEEEASRLIRAEVAGDGTKTINTQRKEIRDDYPENPRAVEKWRAEAHEKISKDLQAQGVKNPDATAGSIVRNIEKEIVREQKTAKPAPGAQILAQKLRSGSSGQVGKNFSVSNAAAKSLAKHPNAISDKLAAWMTAVEKNGILAVRKTSSYHDEPLKKDYPGAHSIRLNRGVRAIYRMVDGKIEIIAVGNDVYDH